MLNRNRGQTFRLTGLRAWRQRTGVTLADLSASTGLSSAYLSRLERGLRQARISTAAILATVVPREELESGSE